MIPFLERWLRKHTLDESKQAFYAKFTPQNRQYPKNSYRTFESSGINYCVDIHDWLGYFLYFGFKLPGQDVLVNLAKEGYYILDVGTNIGTILLQFAAKVGENGKVFGFEPDFINFQRCIKNVELNNFSNLSVENIGMGDEQRAAKMMVVEEDNRGMNRVSESGDIEINIDAIDNWAEKKDLERVDLIKIDVEGFELNVLKGGKTLINKFKPQLFVELDDEFLKKQGGSAQQVIELLDDWQYHCYNVKTGFQVVPADNFDNCHYDILARYRR